MSIIEEVIGRVRVGSPVAHENMTMYPLLDDRNMDPDYIILDEALASGRAHVKGRCGLLAYSVERIRLR